MTDDKENDSEDEESKIDLGSSKIDLSGINSITTNAILNLQGIQSDLPLMLKDITNFKIDLNPTIEETSKQIQNMVISPDVLKLDLDQISTDLITTPSLITQIQKESEIIEKQNETIDLLKSLMEQFKENSTYQNKLLKEVFGLIRELKEEQRLEHPFVDKLYQMALEWGLESIEHDKDK